MQQYIYLSFMSPFLSSHIFFHILSIFLPIFLAFSNLLRLFVDIIEDPLSGLIYVILFVTSSLHEAKNSAVGSVICSFHYSSMGSIILFEELIVTSSGVIVLLILPIF